MTKDEKIKLANLFKKYKHIFSNRVGKIPNFEAEFEIEKDITSNPKIYPIPHKFQREIDKYIENLLKLDIIEPSNINFISPMVCIRKKDMSMRRCLDLRHLNKHIKDSKIAPENINMILNRMHGKKLFSSFDISQGYLNIQVKESLRDYLSFSVNGWFSV